MDPAKPAFVAVHISLGAVGAKIKVKKGRFFKKSAILEIKQLFSSCSLNLHSMFFNLSPIFTHCFCFSPSPLLQSDFYGPEIMEAVFPGMSVEPESG